VSEKEKSVCEKKSVCEWRKSGERKKKVVQVGKSKKCEVCVSVKGKEKRGREKKREKR
jgi:hypothetical protein